MLRLSSCSGSFQFLQTHAAASFVRRPSAPPNGAGARPPKADQQTAESRAAVPPQAVSGTFQHSESAGKRGTRAWKRRKAAGTPSGSWPAGNAGAAQ
eukprot:2792122-Alexandrium_andersonii.AAC.1